MCAFGTVFETIMSAFDELHSQQSKVKGVASMKQNVRDGYRAGGRAPYGYRLKKVETDTHRDGHKVEKSILEIDPETGPIAQEFFERRAKLETRISILDDFYRRGIPSPTKRKRWPVSTAKSMEDNIEVYLGHTVFNKLNERIKENGKSSGYLHGIKYRPKKEWVIQKNTHKPLISKETAGIIQELREKGLRDAPRSAKRIYALSGAMKCSVCGTNYSGDRGIYKCNSGTKPGKRCRNNDISQNTAEQAISIFITQHVLSFNNIKHVIERLKKKRRSGNSDIGNLEKRLAVIISQKRKMIKAYRRGIIGLEDFEMEMAPLKKQEDAVRITYEQAKLTTGTNEIDDQTIRAVIENLGDEIKHADPKIKKRAIQALFDEICIFPKEGTPWEKMLEIKGVHLPLTRLSVASPTGFEPVLPA